MADVRFLPPQDVARTAFSLPARSKTHHGSGDRHADSNAGSKLSANEFVSVRLPELPSAVQERFNAIKMTRGHGAFGPRLTVLDTMTMKQKLIAGMWTKTTTAAHLSYCLVMRFHARSIPKLKQDVVLSMAAYS